MKIHLQIALAVFVAGSAFLGFNSCKKSSKETDQELFEMAKKTDGFVWYKSSDSLLKKSTGSGHSQSLLRTRYNSTAATFLDANGKVLSGAKFTDGSVIVKELYNSSTTLARYAVLYKMSGHKFADENGWVWGYIDADGKVAEKASNKGSACKSCHGQSGNIDYMLMNKFFP